MTLPNPSSVEFAEFIADGSEPGTCHIRNDRLARWLDVEEESLVYIWRASGCPEWRAFAAQVLEILDAFQDISLSLTRTIAWYQHVPFVGVMGQPRQSTCGEAMLPPLSP